MTFRHDIQILRGVAVAMVVLFHLELAGFRSGFLGVDVFFVISGYLMARMYAPADKLGFFVKRARRLLPAYFAAIIATVLASALLVAPNDYRQVAEQATFAAFFASNIGYWLQNSYFNKEEFKPLLHLWSLGVEIQFYLAIPLLHAAFTRLRVTYPVLLLASAACCFVLLSLSTKTAFFWMPFRAWEFLLGYGVARYLARPAEGQRGAALAGALAFLAVLALPIVPVDGTASGFLRGHPGLMALAISLCTAATLHFGLPVAWVRHPVGRAFEKAGDWSYSIYLAHFPVIVLFLYAPFSGTVMKAPDWGHSAVLVLGVAVASALLYALVERPFRARTHAMRWIAGGAFAALVLCPLGALVQRQLVPESDMRVYEAWFDRDPFRCGTSYRMLHPLSQSCEIGEHLDTPVHKVLLVGNSHADSIKSAFYQAAHRRNISEYFIADNGPLMPGGLSPEQVIAEARRVGADALVVHYAPRTVRLDVLRRLATLARDGRLRMAFVMPVPVWKMHVPKMILLSRQGRMRVDAATLADYRRHNQDLIAALPSLQALGVRVYDVAEAFCHPDCDLMSAQGRPYYYDSGHLTLTGSALLQPVFDRVLREL